MNSFTEQPQPIPLSTQQRFSVSPADRSLKEILERWGAQAGVPVDYEARLDYSIHTAAAEVGAVDMVPALAALERAYAGTNLAIRLAGDRIVVTESSGTVPAQSESEK